MSGLNRWASAGLVTVGAGCLIGAYTLLTVGTPAVAETRLIQPITVVATPAASLNKARPMAQPAARAAGKSVQGTSSVVSNGSAQPHAALASVLAQFEDADAADGDDGDDGDGIEPANLIGSGNRTLPATKGVQGAQVVQEMPEAAWLRRLVVARELLREGAVESGRLTLERIIGEAMVCRAYQYALVDLAAVELQRGLPGSAQQLLDEARGSDHTLALDNLTRQRVVKLQAQIQVKNQAMVETEPIELQ